MYHWQHQLCMRRCHITCIGRLPSMYTRHTRLRCARTRTWISKDAHLVYVPAQQQGPGLLFYIYIPYPSFPPSPDPPPATPLQVFLMTQQPPLLLQKRGRVVVGAMGWHRRVGMREGGCSGFVGGPVWRWVDVCGAGTMWATSNPSVPLSVVLIREEVNRPSSTGVPVASCDGLRWPWVGWGLIYI